LEKLVQDQLTSYRFASRFHNLILLSEILVILNLNINFLLMHRSLHKTGQAFSLRNWSFFIQYGVNMDLPWILILLCRQVVIVYMQVRKSK
jgi:hypothetical protein